MPTLSKVTHNKPRRLTTAHKAVKDTGEEWRRGKSAAQRGYGYKWQKARAGYLKKHPLCRHHEARGLIVLAKVVDHIIDHKGDDALFWDSNNWQPLCVICHNIKTASEQNQRGGND